MKWISWAVLLYVTGSSTFAANTLLNKSEAEVINKKSYQAELEVRSWNSTSTIDSEGVEEEFSENEGYSMLEGDFLLRYGYGLQFEARFGGLFRQVESTKEEATKSGAESFVFGMKYAFAPKGKWRYAVDIQYRSSLYENTDYLNESSVPAGEIVLGDSGPSYHVKGILSFKAIGGNILNTSVAYVGRPNTMSNEILYDVNAHLVWKTFSLYAGLEGTKSLGGDVYGTDISNKPPQGRGETELWNSIDRTYSKPYIGLHKTFGRTRIGLEGAQVISGFSTDKGSEITLSLVWNSKGVTNEERKVSKFKEYDIEASVIKVSPRGKFLKIDKGLSQDVEKGMRFDIYKTDYFGGNELVAQGHVFELGADWAIVKLSKKFKKMVIKTGFTARGIDN
ncbi:hypothetical protein A9Q84_18305 [Halobacteriovorax marinus]|uniref:Uncharacterized protein n=1 Tax=Halobacteriovorax marinus TaxID=97084 RepID=A0A1Y5F308_9BACT|nr:hypothetical protein A9Q84_18305 [Halobacteriovorax marinus]